MNSPFEHLNAQQMRKDRLDSWLSFYAKHRETFVVAFIVFGCLAVLFGSDPMETME